MKIKYVDIVIPKFDLSDIMIFIILNFFIFFFSLSFIN